MLCCCISYLSGSWYFVFVCYTECVQEENKVWRYHMNGYRDSFSLKGNAISQCNCKWKDRCSSCCCCCCCCCCLMELVFGHLIWLVIRRCSQMKQTGCWLVFPLPANLEILLTFSAFAETKVEWTEKKLSFNSHLAHLQAKEHCYLWREKTNS